jgi:hypothetical protein
LAFVALEKQTRTFPKAPKSVKTGKTGHSHGGTAQAQRADRGAVFRLSGFPYAGVSNTAYLSQIDNKPHTQTTKTNLSGGPFKS